MKNDLKTGLMTITRSGNQAGRLNIVGEATEMITLFSITLLI